MARTKQRAPFWCKPPFPTQHTEAPGPSRRMTRSQAQKVPLRDQHVGLVKREVKDATLKPILVPNSQSTCPLLTILPPEIREMIFQLALSSYEDLTRPRNRDHLQSNTAAHYLHDDTYRPGFYHNRRTDTALMRTCQIIYLETHLLPAAINTHFVFYSCRRSLYQPMPTRALTLFKRLTPAQLAAVRHVQLFASTRQLNAREGGEYLSNSIFAEWAYLRNARFDPALRGRHPDDARCLGGPHPKIITLTIRHTDWEWSQGRNYDVLRHMLRNRHWEGVFAGLREFRMELEMEWNEHEKFRPTVERLSKFVWDIGNGEELCSDGLLTVNSWVGPRRKVSPRDLWEGGQGPLEDVKFWVGTLVWKVRAVEEAETGSSSCTRTQDGLNE